MRAICAAAMVAVATAVLTTPGMATNYPWCTTGASQEFGASSCGFATREQCMQSASGNGQFCDFNPFHDRKLPGPEHSKTRKPNTKPSR
jgi:hypothetical protein